MSAYLHYDGAFAGGRVQQHRQRRYPVRLVKLPRHIGARTKAGLYKYAMGTGEGVWDEICPCEHHAPAAADRTGWVTALTAEAAPGKTVKTVDQWRATAEEHVRAGRLGQAEWLLAKIIEARPDYHPAIHQAAIVSWKRKKPRQALAHFAPRAGAGA